MGTTPIFGFPYPDPSDLVANYPALGQQLAEDVEDEIIASGGLVRLNTTSFTTQSTVSINNVFTSSYQNYEILLTISAASNNDILNLRLRAAGSDASGATDYNFALWDTNTASGSGASGSAGLSALRIGYAFSSTTYTSISLKTFRPNETISTLFHYHGFMNDGVNPFQRIGAGRHGLANAYDGFSLFSSTGTITGTVRVYGYKNS